MAMAVGISEALGRCEPNPVVASGWIQPTGPMLLTPHLGKALSGESFPFLRSCYCIRTVRAGVLPFQKQVNQKLTFRSVSQDFFTGKIL